jgi:uncharacterized protein (DUF305 family)
MGVYYSKFDGGDEMTFTMNTRRVAWGVSAALSTALALTGCAAGAGGGTGEGMGHDGHPTSGADAAAEANQADVMFAQMMIPHHEQAIEMSDLILAKDGVDPGVVELAEEIKSAQGPEIEQLEAWLDEWGMPSMMDGDRGGMDGMDGMLSDDEMEELEAADGTAGTTLFLEGMIEHHEGAIAMAEQHQESGEHEDALELSADIIESQTAEIERMRELLAG